MSEVRTEITIEAPVERIRELLADFGLYPHWMEPVVPLQSSEFGGILAPLFDLGLRASVAGGMGQMNEAIRRWGEKGNIQCLRC